MSFDKLLQLARSSTGVRPDLVDHLRDEIEDGSYSVDLDLLVNRLYPIVC